MTVKTIQNLIDEALIRGKRERSGKFSPSSFGMCYRAQYWNRKDEPKSNPPDERVLRVFKAGNLFEEFVTDLITKNNSCELQVKCEEEDVLGFADIAKDNEVIDVKSQHSKSFWYMAKFQNQEQVREGKYHNWLQVSYYASHLKKEFMRLVFISKDDLCIKELVDKYEGYWDSELDRELRTLREIWARDFLPPAAPRRWKNKKGEYKECDYCDWKDKCFALEDTPPNMTGE